MRILHLESERYPKKVLDKLDEVAELENFNCHSQKELYQKVKQENYDVIFTKLGLNIDKKVINYLPFLKWIITPTTGLNHIDVQEAEKRNIKIVSLKGEVEFLSTIKSTAEHTWALLLTLIRKLPQAIYSVHQENWARDKFIAYELAGKKLGIIGYGRIGKIIATYANAFDMQVIAYDINTDQFENKPEFVNISETIEELLEESDVVSLHIPNSIDNNYFFNKDLFDKMKPGSIFINTSRGELLEENELLHSLQNGLLSGVAIDVMDGDSVWEKKIPASNSLIEYSKYNRNLIITPHIAGYGKESILKTRKFITAKFLKLAKKDFG